MRYVFVRHGLYKYEGMPDSEKDDKALEPHGVKGALGAADYLAGEHIVPDLILVTLKRRTAHTAEIIRDALQLPDVPLHRTRSGHRGRKTVPRKLEEWIDHHDIGESQTLMFVGHGNSQNALRSFFDEGAKPPSDGVSHCAVLILDVRGRGKEMQIRGKTFDSGLPVP